MERNDSLKSVDPRRGFKPEVYPTTATQKVRQLTEAREMLVYYVNELREVKAQRDALLKQLKIAYQWLSVVPKTYAPHHEQMQGIRAAIALTQKEEA